MLNQAISEFFGCMVISFFSGILRIQVPEGFFLIGLANFFLIMAFCASAKGYSPRYFNPILTLVQLFIGQENLLSAFFTIVFQVIGSLSGAFLIYTLHEKKELNYEKTYYGEPMMVGEEKILSAFLEGLSMFILVLVYNLIIKSKNSPEHIESTTIATCFGYQSGGCLNLTTLIGPSILSNNFNDWGFYMYGQLIGGTVAGLFFSLLLKRRKDYYGNEEEDDEKIKVD